MTFYSVHISLLTIKLNSTERIIQYNIGTQYAVMSHYLLRLQIMGQRKSDCF